MSKLFQLIIIMSFYCLTSIGQTPKDSIKNAALSLFIKCDDCYEEYVKTEIKFVNYVNDRKDADVHLLITSQLAGAEGTGYDLYFIGMARFENIDDTLKYIKRPESTDDKA